MNSVQDNSQAIIIGPLPEGRFSRMHGIQDDETPSPSYRVNEKKGKRASKRSVTIAFTVVLKTLDTSACTSLSTQQPEKPRRQSETPWPRELSYLY